MREEVQIAKTIWYLFLQKSVLIKTHASILNVFGAEDRRKK
jgi:hypothetical protein